MKITVTTAVAFTLLLGAGLPNLALGKEEKKWSTSSYEVWGSDQSNTVPNQTVLGVAGSFLWIWDASDIHSGGLDQHQSSSMVAEDSDLEVAVTRTYATDATPKTCSPNKDVGPCDLFDIFPPDQLVDASTGEALRDDMMGFGRWHGVTKDPQNKYVTANIFAPNGGYLGVVDATTKEAVGLFRVTLMKYAKGDAEATTRNVHMSFWNADGSAILIHNLAGKAVERINVERDDTGKITEMIFDASATVGMGKNMSVASPASYFQGTNAFGNPLVPGGVTGSYDDADLGDLTPTGACKENGCTGGTADAAANRPNNLPICPIVSSNGLVFNTLAGGGLLVLDSKQTPMKIVGAYGNDMVYGAGVCGTQVGDYVYLTSGASASGAGATQSMFTVYAFDPTLYDATTTDYEENFPAPIVSFDDPTNTATGGNVVGETENGSGQLPGTTTRRDAHDVAGTIDEKYVHVVDRIQNVVDVFDAATNDKVGSYDLTTATGVAGDGTVGPCQEASIMDGGDEFPTNDPAPDFIDSTPDGKYMVLSFRGPAPASAAHAAQGSCPGVGVVELLDGGKSGKLVKVLRSTNTVPDTVGDVSPTGGAIYAGSERSDVHDAVVVFHPASKDGATETGSGVDGGDPKATSSSSSSSSDDGSDDSSAAVLQTVSTWWIIASLVSQAALLVLLK